MVNVDNLFARMESLGLTQYRVSKDTRVSQSCISNWRDGKIVPSVDKLVVLANYLDCSLDYLLGRTDDPSIKKRVG